MIAMLITICMASTYLGKTSCRCCSISLFVFIHLLSSLEWLNLRQPPIANGFTLLPTVPQAYCTPLRRLPRWPEASCFSVVCPSIHPSGLFSWTSRLGEASRELLTTWHKRPPGLEDELIRCWWSKVKVTGTSPPPPPKKRNISRTLERIYFNLANILTLMLKVELTFLTITKESICKWWHFHTDAHNDNVITCWSDMDLNCNMTSLQRQ